MKARLLQVVGEEGEHGGPEHGADGRDGGGGAGGDAGRRGGGLGGEGHGGGGGDKDGAGDLLHLHRFLVGRGGGLGRSGRTIESTGAGEERRRGRLLLSGLLCVLVALPEEGREPGGRHL